MFEQSREHVMILESSNDSGTEEWSCPECGRRLLLEWGPPVEWTVLEAGEEFTQHSGSKGGLSINNMDAIAQEGDVNPIDRLAKSDEKNLELWKEWLEKVDFERLWDERED